MQLIISKAQFQAITKLYKSIPSAKFAQFETEGECLTVMVWNGKAYAIQTFEDIKVFDPGTVKVEWDKDIKPIAEHIELLTQGAKVKLYELVDESETRSLSVFTLKAFDSRYMAAEFKHIETHTLEFSAIDLDKTRLAPFVLSLGAYVTYQSGYLLTMLVGSYIARIESFSDATQDFTINKATFNKLMRLNQPVIAVTNTHLWCQNHDKNGAKTEIFGYPLEETTLSFASIQSQWIADDELVETKNKDKFIYFAQDRHLSTDLIELLIEMTDLFKVYPFQGLPHVLIHCSNLAVQFIAFPNYR